MTNRMIDWNNLPQKRIAGYGRDGLVLQISEERCIKIYPPERAFVAQREFENYITLGNAGFLVPEVEELVDVYIDEGRRVKLPSYCEFRGLGLSYVEGVRTVPGIVKSFFPGTPYGMKLPKVAELVGLFHYLERLRTAGFTFTDGIAADFISFDRKTALVDCSSLVDRVWCEKRSPSSFSSISSMYQERIISDLWSELQRNCLFTFSLGLRFSLARRQTRKNNNF